MVVCDLRKCTESGNSENREVSKKLVDSLVDRLAIPIKSLTGDLGPRYPGKTWFARLVTTPRA